jgi:hypothetical protein
MIGPRTTGDHLGHSSLEESFKSGEQGRREKVRDKGGKGNHDTKSVNPVADTIKQQHQLFTPSGEINPFLASLIEELPADGEWTRDEHDLWMRLFQRTLDKLY